MKPATGFLAYATYCYLKNIHFADNKFNIMTISDVPLKDKLINSWNNKRRKKDGLKFKAIEEECSNIKELALLYSSYYINNSNFYIQEIFEDNFETYQNNKIILNNLKEVFTNDLKDIILHVKHEEINIKELFISSTEIPEIFKRDYSKNTLVILNDLFNIIKLNENININSLEMEAWKNTKLNLICYKQIIQQYLNKEDWKQIAKDILR